MFIKIINIAVFIVARSLFGQDGFYDIKIPKFGPYFKQWEDKSKSGDAIAMLELFEWSIGGYNANTDLPLKPVPVCAEWPSNAEKLIWKRIKELADNGDVAAMRKMGFLSLHDELSFNYLARAVQSGDLYAVRDLARTYKYGDSKQKALFDQYENGIVIKARGGDKRAMVAVVCESGFISKATVDEIFTMLTKDRDFYAGVAFYLKGDKALRRSAGYRSEDDRVKYIVEMFESGAKCGEIRAMMALYQLYYYGCDGISSIKVVKNTERAWYWMREYRRAVGCPSPDVDPPKDENGKPWKRPLGPKIIASEQ